MPGLFQLVEQAKRLSEDIMAERIKVNKMNIPWDILQTGRVMCTKGPDCSKGR